MAKISDTECLANITALSLAETESKGDHNHCCHGEAGHFIRHTVDLVDVYKWSQEFDQLSA